jgi:hypothetical protein
MPVEHATALQFLLQQQQTKHIINYNSSTSYALCVTSRVLKIYKFYAHSNRHSLHANNRSKTKGMQASGQLNYNQHKAALSHRLPIHQAHSTACIA